MQPDAAVRPQDRAHFRNGFRLESHIDVDRAPLNAKPFGARTVSEGAALSMIDTQHNWEQFALLLIDVQRDFWPERVAYMHPDFPANIAALLTLCRREGIEVIHLYLRADAARADRQSPC